MICTRFAVTYQEHNTNCPVEILHSLCVDEANTDVPHRQSPALHFCVFNSVVDGSLFARGDRKRGRFLTCDVEA